MIIENLRRLLKSQEEDVLIYDILKKYDFNLNSDENYKNIREELILLNLYPRTKRLKSLAERPFAPELPRSATFKLDFSESYPGNFTWDDWNRFSIQLKNGSWVSCKLNIPIKLLSDNLIKLCKPNFIKNKEGQFVGVLPYEYSSKEVNGNCILGIDIGKINYYSGFVLTNYQNEQKFINFLPSKQIEHCVEKINNLFQEKAILKDKIIKYEKRKINKKTLIEKLNYWKKLNCFMGKKIKRIKEHMRKLGANEIVEIAKRNGCNKIHIENLSVFGNKTGKWDHSKQFDAMIEKAQEYGIEVISVPAAYTSKQHPLTKDIGKISNRTVNFKTGEKVDRDYLAAINIALNEKTEDKNNSKLKSFELSPIFKKYNYSNSKKKKIKKIIKNSNLNVNTINNKDLFNIDRIKIHERKVKKRKKCC